MQTKTCGSTRICDYWFGSDDRSKFTTKLECGRSSIIYLLLSFKRVVFKTAKNEKRKPAYIENLVRCQKNTNNKVVKIFSWVFNFCFVWVAKNSLKNLTPDLKMNFFEPKCFRCLTQLIIFTWPCQVKNLLWFLPYVYIRAATVLKHVEQLANLGPNQTIVEDPAKIMREYKTDETANAEEKPSIVSAISKNLLNKITRWIFFETAKKIQQATWRVLDVFSWQTSLLSSSENTQHFTLIFLSWLHQYFLKLPDATYQIHAH